MHGQVQFTHAMQCACSAIKLYIDHLGLWTLQSLIMPTEICEIILLTMPLRCILADPKFATHGQARSRMRLSFDGEFTR